MQPLPITQSHNINNNNNKLLSQLIQKQIIYPSQIIHGLSYIEQFISKQQQSLLIKNINQNQWNTSLKRRTQHYGYQYKYDKKNQISQAQPIPLWASSIKHKIQEFVNDHHKQLLNKQKIQSKSDQENKNYQLQNKNQPIPIIFNQLIINQYQPGQGINPHIDNIKLFSSPIISLSLGSDCIMQFDHQIHANQYPIQLILKRRSIFILSNQARYQWKHSIPARKKDHGKLRSIRYSLTFRVMNNQDILNIKPIQNKL